MHPLVKSHLLLIAISPQNIRQNRKYIFRSSQFSTPVLTKRQNLVKTHAHTKMRAQIVLSFHRKIRLSKTFYDILDDRIKQEIFRSFQLHLFQNLVLMHGIEVRFASFLSGGFTTMAVISPPKRKLAKRTSVHVCK